MSDVDLEVRLGKLTLKNPVMTASGTFGGSGQEFSPFFDLSTLGAIVVKTITPRPRLGNPPPRTWETPAGMLNSIGLQNPGFERWVEEVLPPLRNSGTKVIINIAGETWDEYFELDAQYTKEIIAARFSLTESLSREEWAEIFSSASADTSKP